MYSFVLNRCGEPVSGVDDGITGQGKDFLAYHLYQQIVVAGRQVATPHTSLKKQVSTNHQMVGGIVQRDAPVAMARGIEHLQALVSKANLIALVQEARGCRHLIHRQAKRYGVGVGLVIDAHATLMAPYRGVECASTPVVARDMINVRVRVDEALDRQVVCFHVLFQLLVLITLTIARVHNYRFARVIVQHQRIHLYGIKMKCPYRQILRHIRQIP